MKIVKSSTPFYLPYFNEIIYDIKKEEEKEEIEIESYKYLKPFSVFTPSIITDDDKKKYTDEFYLYDVNKDRKKGNNAYVNDYKNLIWK